MKNESNARRFTRGGHISFNNLSMWNQTTKMLSLFCLMSWIVVTALLIWFMTPQTWLVKTTAYHAASLMNEAGIEYVFQIPHFGKQYNQSVKAILHTPYYATIARLTLEVVLKAIFIGMLLSIALGVGLAIFFVRKGKQQTENMLIRGSVLTNSNVVKKHIEKDGCASDITIDGFPLIRGAEVQHLLVHGTVGTGKSQLIMKILDALRKRGDRVIVYDKGCSLTPLYLNEKTDVVLNPFDDRCPHWDLWAEAPRDSDLENMAESLIPMHGESDPFWVNAARTVFASVASRMRFDDDRSEEKLLRLLLTGEFEDLESYLQGTPAATLVSEKIEKTAISIRSVITTYLKSLQSLSGLKQKGKASFSIRDYILDETNKGWLFVSSNGEQHKLLKPLISMWLAMASLTLLSLNEDTNRRIWFICDELPSLQKLPQLGETIAEVRKFGGCFLLGMQSYSQLTKVYGKPGAAEIFDLLNTRFFFRSPSSEMARLVSHELGEEEIEESRENYSYGANSLRDGISLGNQRVVRPIVAYPEILELPNLTCFVRLPGKYPVTTLELQHMQRNQIAESLRSRVLIDQTYQAMTRLLHDEELKIKPQDEKRSVLDRVGESTSLQKGCVSEYLD